MCHGALGRFFRVTASALFRAAEGLCVIRYGLDLPGDSHELPICDFTKVLEASTSTLKPLLLFLTESARCLAHIRRR